MAGISCQETGGLSDAIFLVDRARILWESGVMLCAALSFATASFACAGMLTFELWVKAFAGCASDI